MEKKQPNQSDIYPWEDIGEAQLFGENRLYLQHLIFFQVTWDSLYKHPIRSERVHYRSYLRGKVGVVKGVLWISMSVNKARRGRETHMPRTPRCRLAG